MASKEMKADHSCAVYSVVIGKASSCEVFTGSIHLVILFYLLP